MVRAVKFILIIIFVTGPGLVAKVFSQNEEEPAVHVQGRATDRSIKLRWAPSTPATWQLSLQYGYTIERVLLTENGKTLDKPKKILLNTVPIKPAVQRLWELEIDNDDYVAVAAQAIYGETFELADDYKSDIMKVINKAKELESRFSFTVFAADQSIKAAELSGLYFEDQTIAPGSRYLYRVYSNIPSTILKVDTGFVFLGLQDYKALPKPIDFKVTFQDHAALLSWNGTLLEKTYNSFWVERSDDNNRNFKRITEKPIVNAFSGDRPKSKSIFRMDSLESNDKIYYYRVIGINAFGETGPPSDTVSGSGKPVFAYSASVVKHEIEPDGRVKLEWTFPPEGETLLKSFDLIRVDQATKIQTELKKEIARNVRSIFDDAPLSTNYYVIRATDKYGRKNNSFPYLVQTEDSIPPLAPTELTGRIDTLGHVYVSWKANQEGDLLGYVLYRANFLSDEYIQKPGPILIDNRYVDTVRLNTLTEKIYYKIRAVDRRFNPSDFSAILTLEKPDKIPPVPPVFKDIKSDSSGIHISWNVSGSEDVVEHLLYRKAENDHEWTLVKSFTVMDSTQAYRDKFVKHKVNYAYTMLAVDDDGLESIPCQPLTMTYIANDPYPKVENIFYTIDKNKKRIILSWDYQAEEVDKFLIYKSSNDQPLALFKSVDGNTKEVNDEYSLSDTKVEYRIVVGLKTGERTRSSKPLVVKI
jgi:hypothetical protein